VQAAVGRQRMQELPGNQIAADEEEQRDTESAWQNMVESGV
jgi:hypothetical protein